MRHDSCHLNLTLFLRMNLLKHSDACGQFKNSESVVMEESECHQRNFIKLVNHVTLLKAFESNRFTHSQVPSSAICLGWIPGIKIDITFLYGRFFISDYWNWLSKSCWFWGYKKFDPILLEFGFENIAQNFKLRGLRPYAWAFYSQSHPKRSTYYAGHFHTWKKGYLFDFTSTHAI